MKYLLIFLALFSTSSYAVRTVAPEGLGFVHKLNVTVDTLLSRSTVKIYQNKRTGNCYSWKDSVNGGSLTLVDCEDFGIKTKNK